MSAYINKRDKIDIQPFKNDLPIKCVETRQLKNKWSISSSSVKQKNTTKIILINQDTFPYQSHTRRKSS
jgi:hypothetical protein